MKTRKGTPQAPVTFRDVAAYFSETDWKLLHDWQKELYKKVMKEIHQALLSLGYSIVNPDTVLRVHKRGEAHSWDEHKDSDRKTDSDDPLPSCYPSVCPDILLRIKQEENLLGKDRCVPAEAEILNATCKGAAIANSKKWCKIKIEEKLCSEAPWDTEGQKSSGSLSTAGFLFPNVKDVLSMEEESNTSLQDCTDSDGEEGSLASGSEDAVVDSVVSFIIKEEQETYSIGQHDTERKGNISTTTDTKSALSACLNPEEARYQELPQLLDGKTPGDIGMEQEKKGDIYSTYTGNHSSCKTLSRKVKEMIPCGFVQGTNSVNQLCSPSSEELGGEKRTLHESSFYNPEHYNLLLEAREVQASGQHLAFESNGRNAHFVTSQQHKLQNWRSYSLSGCERNFRQTMGLLPQPGKNTNSSTDFEKSFSLKYRSVKQQRSFMGKRHYQCAECEKSFKMKDHLMRHRRIHTGERPYQCMQCAKTFSQKHHLTGHQRTHTGERPYQCAKCRKSFTQKGSLIRHNRTHTGEKPYQCTECEQNFSLKETLLRHQRAHLLTIMQ
ncbi:zinc finger protein 777-like isoform X3 [Ambystoma mexicanum]|uniref:zinc finger protein 777-like isoform X3 n=1 Tax=Ambystoma mexicanum TaxID=8296 RepID=UPI0037E705CA